MWAPKARLSPFSLPVLHTGSKVRPRTRLPGLAHHLLTSAAGPAPPCRTLPSLARHEKMLRKSMHRTRVASAAKFCGLETMRGRPAYIVMSEHVNSGITNPKV